MVRQYRKVTIKLAMPMPSRGGWARAGGWLKLFPISYGWYQTEFGQEVFLPSQTGKIEGCHEDLSRPTARRRLVLYVEALTLEDGDGPLPKSPLLERVAKRQ